MQIFKLATATHSDYTVWCLFKWRVWRVRLVRILLSTIARTIKEWSSLWQLESSRNHFIGAMRFTLMSAYKVNDNAGNLTTSCLLLRSASWAGPASFPAKLQAPTTCTQHEPKKNMPQVTGASITSRKDTGNEYQASPLAPQCFFNLCSLWQHLLHSLPSDEISIFRGSLKYIYWFSFTRRPQYNAMKAYYSGSANDDNPEFALPTLNIRRFADAPHWFS